MKQVKPGYNVLVCCFAAETFFATYGLIAGSTALVTSIGYFISGLTFSLMLIRIPEITFSSNRVERDPGAKSLKIVLALVVIFLGILTSRYWLMQIDIDPDLADMLPVIRTMNERLLSGHRSQVYAVIPELWGGTRPIYLPAMWIPYSPSLLLGIDMRWTTVLSLGICFVLFLYFLAVRWRNFFFWLLTGSAAMLFWWLFGRDEQHGVISLSEEGPVILYYVLLCLALVSRNAWAIGIAILFCLLSRYSFAGWLPAYGLVLLVRKEFRQLFRIAVTVIAGVLLFFILPFGLEPLRQMIALPGNYTDFAARVWNDNPETFWMNLGLAKFFGPGRVGLLHHCLVYGSFGLPLLFAGICLLRRKVPLRNLPVALLKGSLVIFYNLVDVPYGYLFFTGSFVSLILVVLAWRGSQDLSEAIIS